MIKEKVQLKIASPLHSPQEAVPLIKRGASELYCGVLEKNTGSYYYSGCFNTRAVPTANLASFEELERTVEEAHSAGGKVSLAINKFYAQKQYDQALLHAEKGAEKGADSLIVSDIALMLKLKKHGFFGKKFYVSSVAAVYNSESVDFYKQLGASRIILPSQITLEEIKGLKERHKDIEFEVFIFNNQCHNINGFCGFLHGIYAEMFLPKFMRGKGRLMRKSFISNFLLRGFSEKFKNMITLKTFGCLQTFELRFEKKLNAGVPSEGRGIIWDPGTYFYRCGACFLYRLKGAGVEFVKIIGRNRTTATKLNDTEFISRAAGLTGTVGGEAEFLEKVKRMRIKIYGHKKCGGQYCYFND
ncbi:MAG: hypothetical protein FJZ15_05615 [Candidatus Omnitrophica bacterium]|nr:hypothetical protein [Candidatus Omnitrophota bacterium]